MRTTQYCGPDIRRATGQCNSERFHVAYNADLVRRREGHAEGARRAIAKQTIQERVKVKVL